MKTRELLGGTVVAILLLLGPRSAQAGFIVTFDTVDTTQATGILGLDIDGTFYNVTFTHASTTAEDVYGPFDIDGNNYDFTTQADAALAVDSVNDALNSVGALQIGPEATIGTLFYRVGFGSTEPIGVDTVQYWNTTFGGTSWERATGINTDVYALGERAWAKFTAVPAPATMFLFGPAIFALGGRRRKRTAS